MADEIEYKLHGSDIQAVEIRLDPGEAVRAEPGSMIFRDADVTMETGSGGFFSGLKRAFGGEQFFVTTFRNDGDGAKTVAFSAPYPGCVQPLPLDKFGGAFLCQRDCFICGAQGVETEVAFTKRIGAGFFGGEGFVLQRLTGDGLAFVHAGGAIVKRTLEEGQTLSVDTGCLVGMTETVDYSIGFVGGVMNTLFGGEGLLEARLTGPGHVLLQTMPFQRLVDRINMALPPDPD